MTLLFVVKLLSFVVFVIGGNIAWHIYDIAKKKRKPDYVLTWFYRGMLTGLFCVWCTPGLTEVVELNYFVPLFIYCVTTYVLIYNPAMNLMKNKFTDSKPMGFWSLGKTSGYFWDDFWIKNPTLYRVTYFAMIPALLWSLYAIKHTY